MRKIIKNLDRVFYPKTVAIVGASKNSVKIGNVVLKNFLDGKFSGRIYPVNPKYTEILGLKCYPSVKDIPRKLDCVIIATPAPTVPRILTECVEKKAGGAIILSGGFEEVGHNDLSNEVKSIAEKNDFPVIGPNCLGIYNPYTRVDSNFLPMHKLERPKPGDIAFITQSGAVGSTIIDLAAYYGMGISKFISYGNATVLNESDFLEYLHNDKDTKMIIMYIEGTKDGQSLLKWMKKVNRKKPIIVLKAGKTEMGRTAARSHTGNLAGNYLAYHAAFKQARVTEADNITELFDFVKIFSQPLPKGRKMGIITNGGGLGVLTTDSIEDEGLKMAQFRKKTQDALKSVLPSYANLANPLDLVADATIELYEQSIDILMKDENVDGLLINVLFQTPPIDERIINVLVKASDNKKKPIATISVGGEYSEVYRKILESRGVPTYTSPHSAVKAFRRFVEYSERYKK